MKKSLIDFVNATAREKKRVMKKVVAMANKMQQETITKQLNLKDNV